jgi:3-oxoadipate enol-lactonase
MPIVEAGGARIHYRSEGEPGAPALLLSHSLGTDLSMWEAQVPALSRGRRLIRYDTRGHGGSEAGPGPCSIEELGRDVLFLLDALGVARAAFCGLSMGGMIGLWLGLHAPERVERLVLCNTGARIGTPALWEARIEAVRRGGMASVAEGVLARWLTPAFAASRPAEVERLRRVLLSTPPEGYAACCAAIRDCDLREAIRAIRVPALVIAGSLDQATPPADGRLLAERIPGARYAEIEAAHLSSVEAAGPFARAVRTFLEGEEA